ncbi:MAG: SRPBCC family protein [Pseudomonadota bacterium]
MIAVYILIAIVAVFLIGAYLRPRYVQVERHTEIAAAPEAVYAHVSSLKAFHEWSPWTGRDPNMEVTWSGPDQGVGNVMEWRSDVKGVGNGRQEITEVDENRQVKTALDFGSMGTAEAWFDLVPKGDGATRVTWGLNADMGNNPMGRWFGMMMDKWVGADYETGLSNLKARVEGG